jgi:hypothetical protein
MAVKQRRSTDEIAKILNSTSTYSSLAWGKMIRVHFLMYWMIILMMSALGKTELTIQCKSWHDIGYIQGYCFFRWRGPLWYEMEEYTPQLTPASVTPVSVSVTLIHITPSRTTTHIPAGSAPVTTCSQTKEATGRDLSACVPRIIMYTTFYYRNSTCTCTYIALRVIRDCIYLT